MCLNTSDTLRTCDELGLVSDQRWAKNLVFVWTSYYFLKQSSLSPSTIRDGRNNGCNNSIRAKRIRPQKPAGKNQLRRIMLYKQGHQVSIFFQIEAPSDLWLTNPSNTSVPKDLQPSLCLTHEAIMWGKMGILSHLNIGPPPVPWLMSCLRHYHLGKIGWKYAKVESCESLSVSSPLKLAGRCQRSALLASNWKAAGSAPCSFWPRPSAPWKPDQNSILAVPFPWFIVILLWILSLGHFIMEPPCWYPHTRHLGKLWQVGQECL